MRTHASLIVHGSVSPSLLRNLEEFQAAWECCLPERYNRVEIIPDQEQECPKPDTSQAITVFSGGIDSCFTAWRHHTGQAGHLKRNLRAGLFLHGFDIPLRQGETYGRASAKARTMLQSAGMQLVPMAINLRRLGDNLKWGHGSILASCLMMLAGGYAVGIIPSTHPYYSLDLHRGSNPATDELFSSDAFPIIHDGAAYNRPQKLSLIANWLEAMGNLRVCLGRNSELRDQNCCRCEKCIRTILAFRALGLDQPPSFAHDVNNQQILALNFSTGARNRYYQEIQKTARQTGIRDSWLWALGIAYHWNQLKKWVKESALTKDR
jgi:hypothetical protein